MSKKDYPASPIQLTSGMVDLIAKEDDKAMNNYHEVFCGLTKREYFAAMAKAMLSFEEV